MTTKQEQKTEGRKHPGGRPRKYSTPEEMQTVIDKYFEDNPKPTICGLALALGFAQRKSLLNYEGYGKEFCNTIKRAKLIIEEGYEQDLRSKYVTGAIFALKNFNWSDKQEHLLKILTLDDLVSDEDIEESEKAEAEAGGGLDIQSIEGSNVGSSD
jgi:hypothetical protein